MDQVIQIVGAALILVAYVAAQVQRLDPRSRLYLVLNLVGSVILAVLAAGGSQWGFLMLEGAWAVVSLWGLATTGRGSTEPSPRRARRHAGRRTGQARSFHGDSQD